jgi:hypothetical protein
MSEMQVAAAPALGDLPDAVTGVAAIEAITSRRPAGTGASSVVRRVEHVDVDRQVHRQLRSHDLLAGRD